MTLTLELPPEIEARVRQKALAQGLGVEEYAIDTLMQAVREQTTPPGDEQTLAEALVGLIGVLHSDGSLDARDSRKVFSEYLQEKHRTGNL